MPSWEQRWAGVSLLCHPRLHLHKSILILEEGRVGKRAQSSPPPKSEGGQKGALKLELGEDGLGLLSPHFFPTPPHLLTACLSRPPPPRLGDART